MPPVVVRVASAPIAGVYLVTWSTLGGCDPGSGTSGMAGEVMLRVEATASPDSTPTPGELTGVPVSTVVFIRSFCKYRWDVSFVEATTGAGCVVGPDPFVPDSNDEIRITVADPANACSSRAQIVVQVNPSMRNVVDGADRNAILANSASFSATARPAKDAASACRGESAGSRLDDNDTPGIVGDDSVSIVLSLIDRTSTGEACVYDVTLSVPTRLVVTRGAGVARGVDPPATVDFSVGVDSKRILLLQRVVGDSGGTTARYSLTRSCRTPSPIPAPLLPRPAGGGIMRFPPVPSVELREGYFNISAALADDPTADDAPDGVVVAMSNNQGEPCSVTIEISHLPPWCEPDRPRQHHELADPPDHDIFENIVFEFNITCNADPGSN